MPHTIIEHSFEISQSKIEELFLAINSSISKNEGNFDIANCKIRSIYMPNFMVADGSEKIDSIHITIKIFQGRSAQIRKNLAENIIKAVADFFEKNSLSKNPLALSLDVREMEKEIYQKALIKN